jgi:hypothetical protein
MRKAAAFFVVFFTAWVGLHAIMGVTLMVLWGVAVVWAIRELR